MKILIKPAQIKDSEFITKLSDQLGYTTTNDKIIKRLSEILARADNCAFVACDGDIVAGWIHAFCSLRIESDPFAEIGGLVVDSDYRKRELVKC